MKKGIALVLAILIFSGCFMGIAVSASPSPGDPLGWVLHSNVVTYIDGYPIRSYNIDGYTYIIVEDLVLYGFMVEWKAEEAKLIISSTRLSTPNGYMTTYEHSRNTSVPGTRAFEYLYTNITTWIGDRQVTGYNIGGNTCICMDDLAVAFGQDYIWDAENNALMLITCVEEAKAILPLPKEPNNEVPLMIDPEFKAAMDSYEAFFDKYIAFMKSYNESTNTISMMVEYFEFLAQYGEMMSKLEAVDENELNDAEFAYYIEISSRITQKCLEITQ